MWRWSDAGSLLEIYSVVVLETAVSFEQEPPSLEEMATRVERTLASQGFVSLFAGIALPNPASIPLHEKFGLQRVGV